MLYLCACKTEIEMTEEEFVKYRASCLTEYEAYSVSRYIFILTKDIEELLNYNNKFKDKGDLVC